MLDPQFKMDHPSQPDRKEKILSDLRNSFNAEDVKRLIKSDPVIQKWMSLNDIELKDLRGKKP
jgi:hypothetical protein